jgi:hypothetical protein
MLLLAIIQDSEPGDMKWFPPGEVRVARSLGAAAKDMQIERFLNDAVAMLG